MRIATQELEYIPYPGFFWKWKNCDLFVLQDDFQFEERNPQSRNYILRRNGDSQLLAIPLAASSKKNQGERSNLNEIETVPNIAWVSNHLANIRACYRGLPHWDEFSGGFERTYRDLESKIRETGRPPKLVDVNKRFIFLMAQILDIKTPYRMSSDLEESSGHATKGKPASERMISILKELGGDEYLIGPGEREDPDFLGDKEDERLMPEEPEENRLKIANRFGSYGISIDERRFSPGNYPEISEWQGQKTKEGKTFVPSTIDYIFRRGRSLPF